MPKYLKSVHWKISRRSWIYVASRKKNSGISKKLEELERFGSIAIDEMTIKPMSKYKRNHGRYFGKVDMGNVVRNESGRLVNKVLADVFTGLKKRVKIPLAFF